MRVLLKKSLAQLSDAAQQVLAVVGLLDLEPFILKPIASALDLSPEQLRKPLGELVSYGLLLHGEERYAVSHALVHTYARECGRPADEVVQRLGEYYAALTLKRPIDYFKQMLETPWDIGDRRKRWEQDVRIFLRIEDRHGAQLADRIQHQWKQHQEHLLRLYDALPKGE